MIKKYPTYILTGLILLCILNSCSEEEPTSVNQVTATIDGTLWETNSITINSLQNNGNTYYVDKFEAKHDDGSRIEIFFNQLALTPQNLSTSFREKTVSLKSFTAEVINAYIIFNWTTTGSDSEFSHFRIERSFDNYNWEQIVYESGQYANDPEVHYSVTIYNDVTQNSAYPYAYFRIAGYSYKYVDYYYQQVLEFRSEPIKLKLVSDAYFTTSQGKRFAAYNGKITITKYDTNNRVVSGNFSFAYKDEFNVEHKVTNGTFSNVSY